jgi:Uma2 family endonuclease
MAIAETARKLTEAEYLAIERAAEYKSEFYDGQMFPMTGHPMAMAGGTAMHSLIATNLGGEVRSKLKPGPCKAFNSDLRLKVEATGLFTYPDLSVICGELQYAPGTNDTVTNPIVIFEVLSDSTEGYDRGEKFTNYRQMASLQDYVLVSQRLPQIEQFQRGTEGKWTLRSAKGMDASLAIPSLNIVLEFREVYAGVQFPPNPLRPLLRPI